MLFCWACVCWSLVWKRYKTFAELIAINNKPAALELLHSVFTTRYEGESC